MSARRLDIRAAVLGIAMTLTLSVAAAAQLQGGKWQLSPQGNGGRTGVAVRQEPAVVIAQPGTNSLFYPAQPVAFSFVPAILMSDGTVFANFGFGFEPVVRPCFGAVVVTQPTTIGGNGVVLYQPSPPTYTQPVPAQMTASQQMVASGQSRGGAVTMLSHACFSRDAAGRVFAYRF